MSKTGYGEVKYMTNDDYTETITGKYEIKEIVNNTIVVELVRLNKKATEPVIVPWNRIIHINEKTKDKLK